MVVGILNCQLTCGASYLMYARMWMTHALIAVMLWVSPSPFEEKINQGKWKSAQTDETLELQIDTWDFQIFQIVQYLHTNSHNVMDVYECDVVGDSSVGV